MSTGAVVFDLWDTIVDFSRERAHAHRRELLERIGADEERFAEAYARLGGGRETAPYGEFLGRLCADLEADPAVVDELIELRRGYARTSLVPRPGALETIAELRRRGIGVGLISACTSDVPDAWPETEFAPLFDATVFSCEVGFSKPDPRIYALACEQLGVDAGAAVFVGDGANDELAGAERVGMKAVCILPPGRDEALWPEARGWEPTIRSLPAVLELV